MFKLIWTLTVFQVRIFFPFKFRDILIKNLCWYSRGAFYFVPPCMPAKNYENWLTVDCNNNKKYFRLWHKRRLHRGDGGDRPHGQKVVGAMPPSRPHRNFVITIFWKSKMSHFLHLDVWFNRFANTLRTSLCTACCICSFGWSILLCLLFTLVLPKFNFSSLLDTLMLFRKIQFHHNCVFSAARTNILKGE